MSQILTLTLTLPTSTHNASCYLCFLAGTPKGQRALPLPGSPHPPSSELLRLHKKSFSSHLLRSSRWGYNHINRDRLTRNSRKHEKSKDSEARWGARVILDKGEAGEGSGASKGKETSTGRAGRGRQVPSGTAAGGRGGDDGADLCLGAPLHHAYLTLLRFPAEQDLFYLTLFTKEMGR